MRCGRMMERGKKSSIMNEKAIDAKINTRVVTDVKPKNLMLVSQWRDRPKIVPMLNTRRICVFVF